MSAETIADLNSNTLIGYTEKRGNAWHYRSEDQGDEPNHYAGAIPVADVKRRLFDWTALEAPVEYTWINQDGVMGMADDTRKVIFRSDTGAALGVFKNGYQPHQYSDWLIENVETILDADLAVGSAGLLAGGARAWVQVEMEETIESHGVEFRPFLTAATSLDGSLSTTYLTGAQVVVCDNTLSAALSDFDGRIKIKHSRHSLGRLTDVRDALSIVHGVADEFIAQLDELTSQVVTEQQWNDFVDVYTGNGQTPRSVGMKERKTGELNQLWAHDERVAPWRGSAYGVLAAVNTHVHHVQTVRGTTRAERNMDAAITGAFDKLDRGTLILLDAVTA